MITIRYSLGFREHVAMVRAINSVLPRVRAMKAIAWLVAVVFLVTLPMPSVSVSVSGFLALIPLVILPIAYLSPVYMTYLVRRGSPQWAGEHCLTLDETGIEGSNGGATSYISWEAIIRVADTPRFLLLFTGPQVAYGIPKRAIVEDVDSPDVLEYLRTRAGRQLAGTPPVPALITGEPRVTADFGWQTWEAFLALWSINRRAIRVWLIATFAAAIGLFGIGESILFQQQQGRGVVISASLVTWSVMPLLFMLLIYPVISLVYAIWLPRRMPSVGAQRVVVTDDGIRVRGRITAADVSWSMLTRVVETRRFFLFFLSKIQAFYIPKRSLQPQDIGALRTILRQHINERVLKLSMRRIRR